ncbi:MAG: SDR family NAD(P)-dependent oxidoreductase [Lachnospirales bacterium]
MKKKKIAIITGASGGFGHEFVKLLLKENIQEIWTIDIDKKGLLLLRDTYGDTIKPITMDLTNRENINKLDNLLCKKNVTIKYLINNAGYAKFCSYDDISIQQSLNMIDLNISAVVWLGLVCIPYMPKKSYILNIASQASFFPLPYQNIYASTKTFVRFYTRALNLELKDKKIHAIAICPGWMRTGLFKRGIIGAKKGAYKYVGIVDPDVVAKKALSDAKKRKVVSTYGIYVKATHVVSKVVPQDVIMKLWLRQQNIK